MSYNNYDETGISCTCSLTLTKLSNPKATPERYSGNITIRYALKEPGAKMIADAQQLWSKQKCSFYSTCHNKIKRTFCQYIKQGISCPKINRIK